MSEYVMADLGYLRTPTAAKLRVKFSDGSVWDVPLQIVADSRDDNYSHEKMDTVGDIRAKRISCHVLEEWSVNQMDWDSFEPFAVLVETKRPTPNYVAEWLSCSKDVYGGQV